MAQRRPSSSLRCLGALRALAVAAVIVLVPGCELLDGLRNPPTASCEELCNIEDECGLRAYDTCVAESCDDAGVRLGDGSADECMRAVDNCADVALCTCDDSCIALEACTGSPDPSCAGTCESLVEQDVVGTFQENRCRIESTCEDLALCGGV